jgi:hypothetical protein
MVQAEYIKPSTSNWKIFGEQIYEIEQEEFKDKSLDKKMMITDINNPNVILVLLKKNNLVIGFSYALPENQTTARIVDTVIKKEYQGKRLISEIMKIMEKKLREIGYKYMSREAMVENGYAKKITKNYNSRILETKESTGTWGRQIYFKIQL